MGKIKKQIDPVEKTEDIILEEEIEKLEEPETPKPEQKKKKELSPEFLEHLANIRVKALESEKMKKRTTGKS